MSISKELRPFPARFARIKGKLIIGLTGAVCSGKSAALGYFRELGAFCVSTDALAKELLTSPARYNRILSRFSPRVFHKDGSVDRNALAKAVFSDETKRKRLEKILHPEILERTLALIKNSNEKLIVVEAPLLFEAGLERCFDLVICVDAPPGRKLLGAAGRGWTPALLKAREKAQLPAEEKASRADLVLANGGTLKELRAAVKGICGILKEAEPEKR